MWDDGSDGWSVRSEFESLEQAMQPIGELLKFEFTESDDFDAVERALADGCDVFHYAGHTDVIDGRGTLVHRVRSATLRAFDEAVWRIAAPSGGDRRADGSGRNAGGLVLERRAGGASGARRHAAGGIQRVQQRPLAVRPSR